MVRSFAVSCRSFTKSLSAYRGVWLVAVLLGVGCCGEMLNRDKSGTSRYTKEQGPSQTMMRQAFSSADKIQAERGGFEPPVPFLRHSISSAAQSATLPPLRGDLPLSLSEDLTLRSLRIGAPRNDSDDFNYSAAATSVLRC